MKNSLRSVLSAFERYSRFAVTMHVHPDPDAVASSLSMALFLKARGKKVRVFNSDACPQWLEFVPRMSLYEQFDESRHLSFRPEVLVVLDCGDISRIGRVARFLENGAKVVNIDHHVTNTLFGDYNHVLVDYSSTSEILCQLFKEADAVFSRDMAVLLYLGILTDTGSFGFDSTRSHTHAMIADLLKFNFSVSDLYRRVYETLPRQDLKGFLKLMSRLELFFDDRVACLSLSRKQVAGFSGSFDLKDKIFNFLRSVNGLEVIVIFTEQDPKEAGKIRTRLNFRSRGDVDVARLASGFNGGGHKKASGGYLDENLSRSRDIILKTIGKLL